MSKLRIHYLQHVPYEDLGCIESWANLNVHLLTSTRFFEDYTFPNLADFDWLIVTGGPMGVNEQDKYPWLKEEMQFISQAIQAGKP